MPFVPVPKDLSRVKMKVALNMTKRQLVCFGVAAAIGIPVYILTRGALGNEGAVLLMMCLMLPFFVLAMYERDGQPAEKLLRNYIRVRFVWPGRRPYRTENMYAYVEKEGKAFASTQNKASVTAGKTPFRRAKSGENR